MGKQEDKIVRKKVGQKEEYIIYKEENSETESVVEK